MILLLQRHCYQGLSSFVAEHGLEQQFITALTTVPMGRLLVVSEMEKSLKKSLQLSWSIAYTKLNFGKLAKTITQFERTNVKVGKCLRLEKTVESEFNVFHVMLIDKEIAK